MIYDRLESATCYFNHAAWAKAIEYVRAAPSDLADGVHPILGEDVVARVMSYDTKPFEETLLESHRKFVDLQVLLFGSERGEVSTANDLIVQTPYSVDKDVIFYQPSSSVHCHITLEPGCFAVFFPQDAHRTQLRVGSTSETVKKVVVKIAIELLTRT